MSPAQQRERVGDVCKREGWGLGEVHEEIDFSGFKLALDKRHGLRAAVEAVEAGSAQVVVVAYFDRLFRNGRVQAEVIERVEAAGGRLFAADVGAVGAATPGQWITSTMLGVISEYYSRSLRERSGEGQRMAVAEGRVVYEKGPPGYEVADGRLVASGDAEAVREAFSLRAGGATIMEVRAHLAAHGIRRSASTVTRLLGNRTYLGELRFGKLLKVGAHEALVDPVTFDAVQRARVSRGPRPKSTRLLARLGVLRCGTCGARLVSGFRTAREVKGRPRYDIYRCPPNADCPRRVAISADKAELVVVEALRERLRGGEGRASAEQRHRDAVADLERIQDRLDAAIRSLADLRDEAAAVETLEALTAERDAAADRVHDLGGLHALGRYRVEDVETATVAELRELIRLTLRAHVAPGRGPRRVRIEYLV